jgi:hypothetical protein
MTAVKRLVFRTRRDSTWFVASATLISFLAEEWGSTSELPVAPDAENPASLAVVDDEAGAWGYGDMHAVPRLVDSHICNEGSSDPSLASGALGYDSSAPCAQHSAGWLLVDL